LLLAVEETVTAAVTLRIIKGTIIFTADAASLIALGLTARPLWRVTIAWLLSIDDAIATAFALGVIEGAMASTTQGPTILSPVLTATGFSS
jgi:hypothetical protein